MDIKNYVVRSLYKVNNGASCHPDKEQSISPTDYRVYKKMHELTLTSLEKYIGGNWELILLEGEVDNAQQMFRDVFMKTYHLWSEQKCNILFVDLDILALGSIEFFDQYKHFTMFAQIGDERRGLGLDQFYNCGLRYFPHDMDPAVWATGLELYQAWNDDAEWDREQLIYSKMLCSQTDFVFHQVAINSFYFAYDFDAELFKQYKLLHFHSAKGPKPVFALIKKYYDFSEKINGEIIINSIIDKNLLEQLNEVAGGSQEGNLCYYHRYVPEHNGFFPDFEIKRKNMLAIASRYNTITEIGFNAGHSAALMLTANSNLKLTSVDIGYHSYTVPCANIIQNHFPDRHTLILKDSKKICRDEIEHSDVVVIDGGHRFEDCLLDIAICVAYCKPGTLIVVDDYASSQIVKAVNRFSSSLRPCTEYISDADQGIFYLI
jgi:hypothetical protein